MAHDFEWDEKKNSANRQRHGIAFEEAREIFSGPIFTVPDDRTDYGEQRFISIGVIGHVVVVVVVVHTHRGGKTRIISARKANRKERQKYHEHLEAAD